MAFVNQLVFSKGISHHAILLVKPRKCKGYGDIGREKLLQLFIDGYGLKVETIGGVMFPDDLQLGAGILGASRLYKEFSQLLTLIDGGGIEREQLFVSLDGLVQLAAKRQSLCLF